jgi:hypothetical protein
MKTDVTSTIPDAQSAQVIEQYETLRVSGFGEALAPALRSGLALMLRQGMWSWVKAITSAPASYRPAPVLSNGAASPEAAAQTLIQLFAQLTLKPVGMSS